MIDSRSIIDKNRLGILIDSEAFSRYLNDEETRASILLEYSTKKFELLEFLRTESSEVRPEFQNIPTVKEVRDEEEQITGLRIIDTDSMSQILFGYRAAAIKQTGKLAFKKDALDAFEKQSILLIFVQAVLVRSGRTDLFITDRKNLLDKRLWFESTFPGLTLNIVTLDEAIEIIDLFFKSQNQYFLRWYFRYDKGLYYLSSFRSKVPHLYFGDPTLDAFSVRFRYLLESLDKIGILYYSGVNNNTMDDMMYHFNYFVMLVTGIFDSLAIKSNQQYALGFENKSQRISLNPNAAKDFLKAVREVHQDLRNHIHDYVYFIKLIYQFREVIIHRDLLDQTSFESRVVDTKWRMNFVSVNEDIAQLLRQCGDAPQKYDLVTRWGFYELGDANYLLEPFRFAKSVTKQLVQFSDRYLELLGFTNFVEDAKSMPEYHDFVEGIEKFRQGNFGIRINE